MLKTKLKRNLKRKLIQFALGLGILGVVFILHQQSHPVLGQIRHLIYDQMMRLTLGDKHLASRVVIIDIDDDSIQTEGRWPWPRDKFVKLLSNLKKAGVVVVAFDIVLSEAEINYATGLEAKLKQLDNKQPFFVEFSPVLNKIAPLVDNDQAFAQALSNNEIILGYLFHDNPNIRKGTLPAPLMNKNGNPIDARSFAVPSFTGYNGILALFLRAAPQAGFVTNIPDSDGAVRRGLLLAKYNNQLYTSLTLSAVRRFLLTDTIDLLTHPVQGKQTLYEINVGGFAIPVNKDGQILIPFFGTAGTIPTYSASDIINNKLAPDELSGAIALIGSTTVLLSDLHQAPIAQNFPGVEMNANMIAGILANQITQEFDWHTNKGLAILLFTGILLAFLYPFLGPILLPILLISFLTLTLFCSYFILHYKNIYLDPTPLLTLMTLQGLLNFIYSFIQERRQKNKIKQQFSQYVPPSYVKEITDYPEQANLAGESREMTVFFADIRDFTTISESLDATELKHLLNAFFTPITQIIFDNQGTIDKYVGDMVMAFWGAPLHDKEHCHHALAAALSIKAQLPEINRQLALLNLPSVKIGMGLSTGVMSVGDMGSQFRLSYTVIGSTVNLASRLQDLTKFYRVDILASEKTQDNQPDILWLPIDKVKVKGSRKVVTIYEPLGYYSEMSAEKIEEADDFKQSLNDYFNQDWLNAKNKLQKLASRFPEKYLYNLYLNRIEAFIQNPPPADWDGTFIHRHK